MTPRAFVTRGRRAWLPSAGISRCRSGGAERSRSSLFALPTRSGLRWRMNFLVRHSKRRCDGPLACSLLLL
ncbi:uncharacterized protein BKA78DRAFT_309699 [Phyllosticta capitalensis]|uniref:uncharacterized protein n=1 Tax=Phyllosticta capitalensis TaxID=121624 RepID=UPI003131C34A